MKSLSRRERLIALRENSQPPVLIIGGGINGIGVFRDLAAQGVNVVLLERGDFCCGASAALSRMIHGGLRYMENGEFQLVREALAERNRLLKNAPHYVAPLKTTIPIYEYLSGILNASLRFLRISTAPTRRGAVIIKTGLTLYDIFTRKDRVMPTHTFDGKAKTFRKWPDFHKNVKCSATYYDAWITYPERLGLELIQDAEDLNDKALALNYMEVTASDGKSVTVTDRNTGEEIVLQPGTVINATGAWLDVTNKALNSPGSDGKPRLVGGTKGSHLIVKNKKLYDLLGDQMVYYENQEGRVCIMFRYFGNVLIGSTDLKVDDPDEVYCETFEKDYILESLAFVFPNLKIRDDEIVYVFSGVRPLPFSDANVTGRISRDHQSRVFPGEKPGDFDTICMIGGKWTTFRAFGEQVTDKILARLGLPRIASTIAEPIGGGKDYPHDEVAKQAWIARTQKATGLQADRLRTLLDRYGTKAADVARFIQEGDDAPLVNASDYSRREIEFVLESESVVRLEDLLLRRTVLGIGGRLTLKLVDEMLEIMSKKLDFTPDMKAAELDYTLDRLARFHGLNAVRLDHKQVA